MDNRMELAQGTKLSFPGMICRIDSFLGKGSNAIVYIGSYPDAQIPELSHRVLIKELFPFDAQGRIYRDAQGDICRTADAEPVMALHRLSFQRGNAVHLKLLEAYPEGIDANINTFSLKGTLYSVLGFSGGRSLAKELEEAKAGELPLAAHVCRLIGVLNVLEAFHRSGFLHLDISPDNILLIGEGDKERISLIDYNSVHSLREIRQGEAVYYSAKEGFTASEVRMGQIGAVGYPADLYAVTAVFYYLLMGRRLSVLETVRGQIPDVSRASCLAAMPDTVCGMVRQILKRGLAPLPQRRYQTPEQMRQDMEELKDRIEGKGITHAALWETGRRNIFRVIRENPAFRYITDQEKVYPIIGETNQGETLGLEELVKMLLSPEGRSTLLLGSGGAGKTTALMRAAYLQPREYSGIYPAFTYLPLYGWSEGRHTYIKDMILESLKFKPDTESMEMARHELLKLLSVPIQTRIGERPRLVILLDGLNEVVGDIRTLLREISELSGLQGVRILLTSRSDIGELSFQKMTLRPLEREEACKILRENGILVPEQETLLELLCSPMMLSIYIRAVLEREKQLFIRSREELLDSYFAAILDKEIRELPEASEERWQTQAALLYVLPEMARLIHIKGHALSDKELLPVLEKCYRRLRKRIMTRVFPEWIGHLTEIRGAAADAEAWYGMMVHRTLWRRLGVIVRDEQGGYRIAHQLLEEYLVEIQKRFGGRFIRYESVRISLTAVCCVVCAFAAYRRIYIPYFSLGQEEKRPQYDVSASRDVLDAAFSAYIVCAKQYECFAELTALMAEGAYDKDAYDRAVYNCRNALESTGAVKTSLAESYLQRLYQSGEVMPWSKRPLEQEAYLELIALPEERAQAYAGYLDILLKAAEDEAAWRFFDGEDYVEKLALFLEADARLLGKYYNMVAAPELAAMEKSISEEEQQDYRLYMKTYAMAAGQNQKTKEAVENIEIYRENRNVALQELLRNGLVTYFAISEEKDE